MENFGNASQIATSSDFWDYFHAVLGVLIVIVAFSYLAVSLQSAEIVDDREGLLNTIALFALMSGIGGLFSWWGFVIAPLIGYFLLRSGGD